MKNILTICALTIFSIVSAQVGIKTTNPTATLDVNGNLRVRNIPVGSQSDSLVVVNNGFIRKIALSSITSLSAKCPEFVKSQSNPYYLLFKSDSSVQNPNNPITIDNKNFVSAGTWVQNNLYYFSWTNVSGLPLNINNFTVIFNNKTCVYQ